MPACTPESLAADLHGRALEGATLIGELDGVQVVSRIVVSVALVGIEVEVGAVDMGDGPIGGRIAPDVWRQDGTDLESGGDSALGRYVAKPLGRIDTLDVAEVAVAVDFDQAALVLEKAIRIALVDDVRELIEARRDACGLQ
jgi:hypothetical protein